MKLRRAGTQPQSLSRWNRIYARSSLVLTAVLAIVVTTALFTAAISRADGPPDMGRAFSLPFALEQGRPSPVLSPSESNQRKQAQVPAATPSAAPAATPSAPATNQPNQSNQPKQTVIDPSPSGSSTIKAQPLGTSIVHLTWTMPDGQVDGYQVASSDDNSSWSVLAGPQDLTDGFGAPIRWYQRRHLQGNETTYYRVRSRNGPNWSDWSASASATTFPEGSPLLRVEAGGTSSVNLSWEDGSSDFEITGWELQTADSMPDSVDFDSWTVFTGFEQEYDEAWTILATPAAEDRKYTHRNLPAGATRYYRLRAMTEVGEGGWTRPFRVVTFQTSTSSAPSLSARSAGASGIVLTWTKPPDRSHPITEFDLQWSTYGERWERIFKYSADDTKAEIHVEEPGTEMKFRIRANNAEGLGRWSRVVRGVSDNGGAGDPQDVEVESFEDTWAKLAWSAPEDQPSRVTGYQIERSKISDPTWQRVGGTGPNTLTFRDTGLKHNTSYVYRVAARDSGGLGLWGYSNSIVTWEIPPEVPVASARDVCRVGSSGGENFSPPCVSNSDPERARSLVWIHLTWNMPEENGTTIVGYEIERSRNGRDGWEPYHWVSHRQELKNDHSIDSLYFEDRGVGYGETWYYRIRTNWNYTFGHLDQPLAGTDNVGSWSKVVSATTMSFVPDDTPFLVVRSLADNRFEINWQPPLDDGGRPINRYQLQVSTEGSGLGANWSDLSYQGPEARKYVQSNIVAGSEYCYRLRARNSHGWGHWQDNFEMCWRLGPAAPDIKVRTDDTQAEISWVEPTSQGINFARYELSFSGNGTHWPGYLTYSYATTVKAVYMTYADARDRYFSGQNPTEVFARIRVVTKDGSRSEWSEAVSFDIPSE